MQNNFDEEYENAKKLIFDDTNVTQSNVFKDFVAICLKLALILAGIYIFIFFASGIILKTLDAEHQQKFENMLASSIKVENIDKSYDTKKLKYIRNRIIKKDKDFPITKNLNIEIIKSETKNAVCLPNGNIYITSALLKDLKDDEMLTFVIAHEMAHYKYKDHLIALRKSISGGAVGLFMVIVSPDNADAVKIVNNSVLMADMKHSRSVERRADKYAANILKSIYGNTNGGIRVLTVLKEDGENYPEILSTHPDIEKRLKWIKKP